MVFFSQICPIISKHPVHDGSHTCNRFFPWKKPSLKVTIGIFDDLDYHMRNIIGKIRMVHAWKIQRNWRHWLIFLIQNMFKVLVVLVNEIVFRCKRTLFLLISLIYIVLKFQWCICKLLLIIFPLQLKYVYTFFIEKLHWFAQICFYFS